MVRVGGGGCGWIGGGEGYGVVVGELAGEVVISDFATDEQCKGVDHHLGNYKSEGYESVSW
ncbi:hypothetical protein A2U01_0068317 [Trifolium medium]|uniref:Uncharacterized protein n=1 Tax=Trifolium medium TaxID=97028 RepID=A0A392SGT8_9FABA|nr:hypothetical protein [Trifolium medium]